MTDARLWEKFTSLANYVVERETVFEMRRRMNSHHPQDAKDYESNLHNKQQQQSWAILKKWYCENESTLREFYKATESKKKKKLFEAVAKVIDDEMKEEIEGMLDGEKEEK